MNVASASPGHATARDSRTGTAAAVPLALLSAALVIFAFPLYGARFALDHLVWIALVPLFLAARGQGGRQGFLLGWLAGLAIEGAGFIWILFAIRTFTSLGAVGSSLVFLPWLLYSSIPWGVLGWALGRCRESRHVFWVLPLWVGVEDWFPRLTPWHLGGALYSRSWLLQCVDLLGASGLTALVFLVSGAAYVLVERLRERQAFPWRSALGAVLLTAAALGYGAWRLADVRRLEASAAPLRVAVIQGSVPPNRETTQEGRLRRDRENLLLYLERSEELLREAGDVDLLVWPEGSIPVPFDFSGGQSKWLGLHPKFFADGVDLWQRLRRLGVPLIAGGSAIEIQGDEQPYYNVTVYFPSGKTPVFYRKNRPMPFGEYNPLLELLSAKQRADLGLDFVGNITPGTENPLMRAGEPAFRNLICYESILPSYMRRAAAGADYLVNITEDYWYGHTAQVLQDVSVLTLRTVECRTPVVRCSNVGPSGVFDSTGVFHGPGKVFEPASAVEEVRPLGVSTVYQSGGHWFSLICLVLGAALQWALRR